MNAVSIFGFFFPNSNQYQQQKKQEIKPQRVLDINPLTK